MRLCRETREACSPTERASVLAPRNPCRLEGGRPVQLAEPAYFTPQHRIRRSDYRSLDIAPIVHGVFAHSLHSGYAIDSCASLTNLLRMRDYPKTVIEFRERLATEEACRVYLASLRWPEGFVCPQCSGRRAWAMQRALRWRRDCGYQSSVTARTLFQDTHKPLRLCFVAMWYVTNQKSGVSALGLQRVLGLGSYHIAWSLKEQHADS
ncbi:MAG: Transposase zinc-ribbon domain protein [Verrucomicrobia bacterium ADurb.Bin006]|nr:MAG: Transposase zinc-ribbon domain protein [Verrucomicrobia bacterium ADurb.Bin006]